VVARGSEQVGRLLLGYGRFPQDASNGVGARGFGDPSVLDAIARTRLLGGNGGVYNLNLRQVSGWLQARGRNLQSYADPPGSCQWPSFRRWSRP